MRKILGYMMLCLFIMGWGFMGYPIPEAVNPFESWLMSQGFSDLQSVVIEILILVVLAVTAWRLLRRPSDPREYSH